MPVSEEERVLTVFLQRFNKQHLPVLLQIKQKALRGEELDQSELEFLEQVFAATHTILPKVIVKPEYRKVFTGAIQLYNEITELVLNNAQNSE